MNAMLSPRSSGHGPLHSSGTQSGQQRGYVSAGNAVVRVTLGDSTSKKQPTQETRGHRPRRRLVVMDTARISTRNPMSRRTDPNDSGGISLRKNFSGGSVTV